MEHRVTGPQGSPSSNGPALPPCSWTRKLGTPYGPGPSTGTTQRNNRDPPPAYDTQRRYRRARVSASSLDGDGTWCTTHATANKPPTNEDAQTCGPGAGLALGLGGISSDGLGVTGRVCDAASPHGCRHASPEHPGMPGDSDTCATNIEYCPSLETRRYPTHSAQAYPRHQDGAAGSQGPRSRRDPPRCHYLGQPCPVGPVFGRDVHAGGRTGPGTTW